MDWNQFNTWNCRDAAMAKFWNMALTDWAVSFITRHNVRSCLDYGCGYFDFGRALIPYLERVDGYDPHVPSVQIARSTLSPSTVNVSLYTDADRLIGGSYDMIVVNSVIQYFHDEQELVAFFQRSHELLQDNGHVLIADIIPPNFSAIKDGLNSLSLSLRHSFFMPMVIHLAKSMKVKDLGLRKYSDQDMRTAATHCGFTVERLPCNLTPSRERYTCLFRKSVVSE